MALSLSDDDLDLFPTPAPPTPLKRLEYHATVHDILDTIVEGLHVSM